MRHDDNEETEREDESKSYYNPLLNNDDEDDDDNSSSSTTIGSLELLPPNLYPTTSTSNQISTPLMINKNMNSISNSNNLETPTQQDSNKYKNIANNGDQQKQMLIRESPASQTLNTLFNLDAEGAKSLMLTPPSSKLSSQRSLSSFNRNNKGNSNKNKETLHNATTKSNIKIGKNVARKSEEEEHNISPSSPSSCNRRKKSKVNKELKESKDNNHDSNNKKQRTTQSSNFENSKMTRLKEDKGREIERSNENDIDNSSSSSTEDNKNIIIKKVKFSLKESKNTSLGLRMIEDAVKNKCHIENVKANSIAEKKDIRKGDIIVIPITKKKGSTMHDIDNDNESVFYMNAKYKEVLTWVQKFQNGLQDLILYLKRDCSMDNTAQSNNLATTTSTQLSKETTQSSSSDSDIASSSEPNSSKPNINHPLPDKTIIIVQEDTTPCNNRQGGYARILSSNIEDRTYQVKMIVSGPKNVKVPWDETRLTEEEQDEFSHYTGASHSIKRRRGRRNSTVASTMESNCTSSKNSTTTKRKNWSQYEIEAFIVALRNIDTTMTKKELFEHIAKKIKTRNGGQCEYFFKSIKVKVEISKTASYKEYVIYNLFKSFENNNCTKDDNGDDDDDDDGSNNNICELSFKDDTVTTSASSSSLNTKKNWSQFEIDEYISALKNSNLNNFSNQMDLFEHISKKIKTRTKFACYYYYRRMVKKRVETLKTQTSKDVIIYDILNNFTRNNKNSINPTRDFKGADGSISNNETDNNICDIDATCAIDATTMTPQSQNLLPSSSVTINTNKSSSSKSFLSKDGKKKPILPYCVICNPKKNNNNQHIIPPSSSTKEHSNICPNSNNHNYDEYISTRLGIKQGCTQCYKYFNFGIIIDNNLKHSCDKYKKIDTSDESYENNLMTAPTYNSQVESMAGCTSLVTASTLQSSSTNNNDIDSLRKDKNKISNALRNVPTSDELQANYHLQKEAVVKPPATIITKKHCVLPSSSSSSSTNVSKQQKQVYQPILKRIPTKEVSQEAKSTWIPCNNPWGTSMYQPSTDIHLVSYYTSHIIQPMTTKKLQRFKSYPLLSKQDSHNYETKILSLQQNNNQLLSSTSNNLQYDKSNWGIEIKNVNGICYVDNVIPNSLAFNAIDADDILLQINDVLIEGLTIEEFYYHLDMFSISNNSSLLVILARLRPSTGDDNYYDFDDIDKLGHQQEQLQKHSVIWKDFDDADIDEDATTIIIHDDSNPLLNKYDSIKGPIHPVINIPYNSTNGAIMKDYEQSNANSISLPSHYSNGVKTISPEHQETISTSQSLQILKFRNDKEDDNNKRQLSPYEKRKITSDFTSDFITPKNKKRGRISKNDDQSQIQSDGNTSYEKRKITSDFITPKNKKRGRISENDDQSQSQSDSNTSADEDDEEWLGCICGKIHPRPIVVFWIQCDRCDSWYNVSEKCAGFDEKCASTLPSWICRKCLHGCSL